MDDNKVYLFYSRNEGSEIIFRGVFSDENTFEDKARELIKRDLSYIRQRFPHLKVHTDEQIVDGIILDLSSKKSGEWTDVWAVDYMFQLVELNKLL
jgi:hypothetical protein